MILYTCETAATMAKRLNHNQLQFVKVYLGTDPITGGNANKSYRFVYGEQLSQQVSQASGAKLLHHPLVEALIRQAETRAIEEIHWNAKKVLEQSVRLYDRCMGDTDYPVTIDWYDKAGEPHTTTVRRTDYNPAGARAALELIGRNRGIQAFQENIEVSHTHYLEQQLSARARVIEGKALMLAEGEGEKEGASSGG